MDNNLPDFISGVQEEKTTTTNTNNEKSKSKVFKNFVITLSGSVGVYGGVFLFLNLFGVPFIWNIFLGFGVGMMCFAYLDSISLGNPEYSKPILLLMLIILILSLSVHYLPESGASNNMAATEESSVTDNVPSSEFGIIKSVDQVWKTTKVFKAGSRALVKIRGAAVRMANGDVLTPCDYSIQITDNEPLIFMATENITTTIEVIY